MIYKRPQNPSEYATVLEEDMLAEDTDGEGLADIIESYIIGSSNFEKDSHKDEILDSNEDYDEDGLTNLEKVRVQTNLGYEDSDEDGITDGRERRPNATDNIKLPNTPSPRHGVS